MHLSHIAKQANAMLAAGIMIPFSKSHEKWRDTDQKLGKIVGASVDKNSKGVDALFLDVEFDNEAARDLSLNGEVSVGVPDRWQDGTGRTWHLPLQHAITTAAPVVAGMDSWQSLAASFAANPTYMSTLYELLGVDTDEAALEAVQGLQTKVAELTAPKLELSFDAPILKTFQEARIARLNADVTLGEIGPATRDEMILAFANDKFLGMELSQGSTDTFEQTYKLVKLASKNPPVRTNGRMSHPSNGAMELSHNADSGPTPLDAIIDRMVEKAKK